MWGLQVGGRLVLSCEIMGRQCWWMEGVGISGMVWPVISCELKLFAGVQSLILPFCIQIAVVSIVLNQQGDYSSVILSL